MKKIYNILEVANTHGGNVSYIKDLLDEFKDFKKKDGFGIKFQPFKYDQIATNDYEWFKVYKELFIKEDDWKKILDKAFNTKDIWIDIFDLYGISIVRKNLKKIYGLKLQTSILENQEVFKALKNLDISNLKLIIKLYFLVFIITIFQYLVLQMKILEQIKNFYKR